MEWGIEPKQSVGSMLEFEKSEKLTKAQSSV